MPSSNIEHLDAPNNITQPPQVYTRKNNPCYTALIIIAILSILLTLSGILLIICGSVSIGITTVLLNVSITFISLGIIFLSLACLGVNKIDKYLLRQEIKLVHDKSSFIDHVFEPQPIPTFTGNNSTNVILNSLAEIFNQIPIKGMKYSSYDINEHCLCVNFEDDNYYNYKISYSCRNILLENSTTRVKSQCQANRIASNICKAYKLDRLKVPSVQHMEVPLYLENNTLVYDIAIEEKLPFTLQKPIQSNLYSQSSEDLKTIVQQLSTFICITGCSSIDFQHIPINPNNPQEAYLLDLDIDLHVTEKNIEDGLFGTFAKKGLLRCLKSKELIEVVLQTAQQFGINIHSNRIQQLIQEHLDHLKLIDELEKLYNQPPATQPSSLKAIEFDDYMDVNKEDILEIDPSYLKKLSSNISNIINGDYKSLLDQDIVKMVFPGVGYDIFKLKDETNQKNNIVYYSFYRINTEASPLSLPEINNHYEDVYETSVIINNLIKEHGFDALVTPKARLLEFSKGNRVYYLLALEELNVVKDRRHAHFYSFMSSNNNLTQATEQLIHLNYLIDGLTINKTNTFLLNEDSRSKIAFINLSLAPNPIRGLFGSNIPYDYGILSLAKSEHDIDKIIMSGIKEGYFDETLVKKQKEACLSNILIYGDLKNFYITSGIAKNDPFLIAPNDLKEYLDLDLILQTEGINYFDQQNIKSITMFDAVLGIVSVFNNYLMKEVLPTTLSCEDIASNRFLILSIENSEQLSAYSQISVWIDPEDANKPLISCLDLVKEAFIAKGVAFPHYQSYKFSRFDKSKLRLHI